MYGVIYKTTNLVNGKIYVGQHKTKIIEDGYIGSGKLIQRSIEKYGRENFSRVVLEVVMSREEAKIREEFWISLLNATDPAIGYNITKLAWGGQPITTEARAKISAALKGKPQSEETKQKLRVPKSAETRQRMAAASRAAGMARRAQNKRWFHNPVTGEARQYSEADAPDGWVMGRGKITYKKTREFSETGIESLRKNARDPARRKKVSETLTGHAVSDTTRQKISESLKSKRTT